MACSFLGSIGYQLCHNGTAWNVTTHAMPYYMHVWWLAVPSGSRVIYRCPRIDGAWIPSTIFFLNSFATAGPACCSSSGLSNSTAVSVTGRSFLAVTGHDVLTECGQPTPVLNVTFRVISGTTGALITVPSSITASDGRVCNVTGDISNCE